MGGIFWSPSSRSRIRNGSDDRQRSWGWLLPAIDRQSSFQTIIIQEVGSRQRWYVRGEPGGRKKTLFPSYASDLQLDAVRKRYLHVAIWPLWTIIQLRSEFSSTTAKKLSMPSRQTQSSLSVGEQRRIRGKQECRLSASRPLSASQCSHRTHVTPTFFLFASYGRRWFT